MAIGKGFDSIGSSGHSYMFFSKGHSMSPEGTEEYKREITELKSKYRGKIDILGLELYSEVPTDGYDYIIGSCHYFRSGDEYVGFVSSVATSMTIFGMMDGMDKNGVMLNSAFEVSAVFMYKRIYKNASKTADSNY